jgi:sugar-specific transcriptional regulator TrmB
LISGSIVPTNPNNYQGDFSWSRSIEAFPKPKRRGRPTGSKNKVKNNSIESINEFEDMTIVKGSFNEIYEYSDEVLLEQIKLEEVVTGSFENITQEEIESDVVEDITFEPIDEDYDISSGEPEEEIIIIPSTNKSKSRNYREPKSDVKKNFLNRS